MGLTFNGFGGRVQVTCDQGILPGRFAVVLGKKCILASEFSLPGFFLGTVVCKDCHERLAAGA